MKNKLFSVAASFALLMSVFTFAAHAEPAPESQSAVVPAALCFTFDYPNEGSERITVCYRLPEKACRFAAMSGEEKTAVCGFDGSYILQFDWAVDSQDDWHWSEDWDTGAGDYIYLDVGVDMIAKGEFLWFTYDDDADRCSDALKSKKADDGETARVFDFARHQLYARARLVCFDSDGENAFCSAWTDTCRVNDSYDRKSTPAPVVTGLTAPVVSEPFSGSVDGQNCVCFDISLGGDLMDAAWTVKRATGEDLTLKSQIRLNDGEWQYWSLEDELYPYVSGLRTFTVNDKMLSGKLEFRCCLSYDGNAAAGIDAFSSPWSKNIVRTADDSFSIVKNVDEKKSDKSANGKCTLCGICSQPLGVCAFVWLTLAVLAVILAVIIARAVRHNKSHVGSIEAAAKERLEKGQAEESARKASAGAKAQASADGGAAPAGDGAGKKAAAKAPEASGGESDENDKNNENDREEQ